MPFTMIQWANVSFNFAIAECHTVDLARNDSFQVNNWVRKTSMLPSVFCNKNDGTNTSSHKPCTSSHKPCMNRLPTSRLYSSHWTWSQNSRKNVKIKWYHCYTQTYIYSNIWYITICFAIQYYIWYCIVCMGKHSLSKNIIWHNLLDNIQSIQNIMFSIAFPWCQFQPHACSPHVIKPNWIEYDSKKHRGKQELYKQV